MKKYEKINKNAWVDHDKNVVYKYKKYYYTTSSKAPYRTLDEAFEIAEAEAAAKKAEAAAKKAAEKAAIAKAAAKKAEALKNLYSLYNYRGYIISETFLGYKIDTVKGVYFDIEDAFDAIDLDIAKGGD